MQLIHVYAHRLPWFKIDEYIISQHKEGKKKGREKEWQRCLGRQRVIARGVIKGPSRAEQRERFSTVLLPVWSLVLAWLMATCWQHYRQSSGKHDEREKRERTIRPNEMSHGKTSLRKLWLWYVHLCFLGVACMTETKQYETCYGR